MLLSLRPSSQIELSYHAGSTTLVGRDAREALRAIVAASEVRGESMSRRFRPSPAEVNEFCNRRRRALRIFHSEQFVRSESDHFNPSGMRKNVELLLPNCLKDRVSDLKRWHACFDGGLECGQPGLHFRCHRDRFVTQLLGPATLGVGDIGPHKARAENRYSDKRVALLKC